MTDSSRHTPTFNMKVVARETGLKPDTLRAWERRYGMPNPERTSGGHRLYSQYEIDMLKWLMARQDEGLSISHAIDLWQQIVDRGNDPLQAYKEDDTPSEPEPVVPISGDMINEIREAWLQACLSFNEYRAQQVLAQAFARFPLEAVCFEVLQKGLSKIGQAWYEGDATVQQEHFASSMAIRQLEALLASTAPPTQDVRLLVACPPHEQHTFSPLLITLLFRRRGWDVVYLGANVPVERLETAVTSIQPDLVILAAQTLNTAANMLDMAHFLYELEVPMAYGGAVFNYLEAARRRIPGHFLGTELQSVPERVTKLLQSDKPVPDPVSLDSAYETALQHFTAQRTAVEADVLQMVDGESLPPKNVNIANENLGDNIVAALKLGEMDLLTANINWVQGLLMNYHDVMPDRAMRAYLSSYHDALQKNLDRRSQLIVAWFNKLIKSANAMQGVRHTTS